MDDRDFAEIRPLLDEARTRGAWLVLAGHDIGAGGRQTTRIAMLDELLAYAKAPSSGIWLAPVGDVRGGHRQAPRHPVTPTPTIGLAARAVRGI